ncbi:hypothetical protein CHUAL_008984 [Chamberlinius hualienensis]
MVFKMDEWIIKAQIDQVNFFNQHGLCLWDNYHLNEEDKQNFKQKLSQALFNYPQGPYTKKETEDIEDIYKKCVKHGEKHFNNEIYLKFLFISSWNGKDEEIINRLLVKVRKDETNSCFIDHLGRVYKNWFCYLKENTWNGFHICFPAAGTYNYQIMNEEPVILLDFIDLTTLNFSQILEKLDKINWYVPKICLVVPLIPHLSFLVVPCAAVSSVSSFYAFIRSIVKLNDRRKHELSLNPIRNSEARGDLLTVGFTVVGYFMPESSVILSKFKTTSFGRKSIYTLKNFCDYFNLTPMIPDHVFNLPMTENILSIAEDSLVLPEAISTIPGANFKIPESKLKIPGSIYKVPQVVSKFSEATLMISDVNLKIPEVVSMNFISI